MIRSAVVVAVLLLAGSASAAQVATPAAKSATPPKAAAAAKPAPVVHSAASIDCSKQADAKGLHGKARKEFRSSCKASAKKG